VNLIEHAFAKGDQRAADSNPKNKSGTFLTGHLNLSMQPGHYQDEVVLISFAP